MIMPHELTYSVDDVVNRIKRCRPLHLGFEPLPEAFDRVILRGIGCQVFEDHPVVLREEPLDGTALVNRGIIQAQDAQGLRKALVQLREKLQAALGGTACRPLPIEALGAPMQGAKQGGTLALRRGRDFALLPLATPAALDIGFISKMRLIDTEDCYGSLCVTDADGGDNVCPPRCFFSALGALRGTVWAKRL
jgi:hypothetical protein